MLRRLLLRWLIQRRLGPGVRVTSQRFDKVVFGQHVGWWHTLTATMACQASNRDTVDQATALGRRLLLEGIAPSRWLLAAADRVMIVVTTETPPEGLPRQIIRLPIEATELARAVKGFRELGGWNAPTTHDSNGDDEADDPDRVAGWRWGIRKEWLDASRNAG